MALEFLLTVLVGPIVKQLVKLAFDDGLGSAIADQAFDWGKGRLTEYQAGKAKLSVTTIAKETIRELTPLFEQTRFDDQQRRNVAGALARTLDTVDVAPLVIEKRFEAAPILAALQPARERARDDLDPGPFGLYEQALGGIVEAFCRVAGQLPRFQENAVKATLDALDAMAGHIAEVLSGIGRIEAELKAEKASKAAITDENERFYREALRADVARLRLFGLDRDEGTADELPLEIAYIPLQLALGEGRRDSVSLEFAEVLELLPMLGNRLLIEGLGGSGKSTLLQWTALKALDVQAGRSPAADRSATQAKLTAWMNALTPEERSEVTQGLWPSRSGNLLTPGIPMLDAAMSLISGVGRMLKTVTGARWCDRTPFLVRLRDFGDGRLPKPEDLPELIAAEALGSATEWVRKTIMGGKALILLDGIDEVPGESRDSLADSIAKYLSYADSHGCQIIVTSRPAAVLDPRWKELFGPVRATVREMSGAEVERFVEHWHRAVAQAAKKPVDFEAVDRVIGRIRDRPALAPLAETPLLCAAICYLYRATRGDIPERAERLYEQLCRQLVHRLDVERLKSEGFAKLAPALTGLDVETKLGLLSRLAAFMLNERLTVLDMERARRQIETGLRQIGALEGRDPAAVLNALLERSGVLRGWSNDEVAFAHNRLRSYLAARAYKDDEAVRQPIEAALDTADPDLPVLAAALGSNRYREQMIDGLVEAADGSETPRLLKIMALRAAATGPLSEACRERVTALEREVLPPRDPEEAAQVAELGKRIAPALAFEAGREAGVDAACVRALRLIGAEEVVEGYLGHEDEEVLDEVAQVVNPLRIPAVLRYVMQEDERDHFKPVRHLRPEDLAALPSAGVRGLTLRTARLSDLEFLASFPLLKFLSLSETQVSDLAPLKAQTPLLSLHLDGTQVSDLAPLKDLSALQSLLLDDTQISDLGLLKELTGLQALGLSGTQVSDLNPLKDLTALKMLTLSGAPASDLTPLKGLTALQKLFLDGTQVSDLYPIKDLTALDMLALSSTHVSDLAPLKDLTALEMLSLGGTLVSDLSPLKDLTALQNLFLDGTQVSDLGPLKNLTSLKMLTLTGTQLSENDPVVEVLRKRSVVVLMSASRTGPRAAHSAATSRSKAAARRVRV